MHLLPALLDGKAVTRYMTRRARCARWAPSLTTTTIPLFHASEVLSSCRTGVTGTRHRRLISAGGAQTPTFRTRLFVDISRVDTPSTLYSTSHQISGTWHRGTIERRSSADIKSTVHLTDQRLRFNPLKGSGIRWLHFKVFSAIQI